MKKENRKQNNNGKKGKILSGTIVSNKMKDTVVVLVSRYVKHPKYEKYMKIHKKFKAHDAGNLHSEGQEVEIIECRPISKDKKFKVVEK